MITAQFVSDYVIAGITAVSLLACQRYFKLWSVLLLKFSANVDVDLRIVNDNGEEVFAATKSITDDDFGYYESNTAGTRYLADIRIPDYVIAGITAISLLACQRYFKLRRVLLLKCVAAAEIKEGKSSSGTVYFTVRKGTIALFDEANCMALYCLPVSDIKLTVDNLPVDIKVKGYDGNTESMIQITEVSYTFEKEYTPQLKITLTGQIFPPFPLSDTSVLTTTIILFHILHFRAFLRQFI